MVIVPSTTWEEVRRKLGDQLGDRLGDTEWKILEKVWRDPNISIPKMASQIGISTTAIEKNINKLKAKNILERKGSVRKGYWSIVF